LHATIVTANLATKKHQKLKKLLLIFELLVLLCGSKTLLFERLVVTDLLKPLLICTALFAVWTKIVPAILD